MPYQKGLSFELAATGFGEITAPATDISQSGSYGFAHRILGTSAAAVALFFCSVGTGGIQVASLAMSANATGASAYEAAASLRASRRREAEQFVSVPDQIAAIRQFLSLNMTDAAKALQIERPTLYSWLRDGVVPRQSHLSRIRDIYQIAVDWHAMSNNPVGKFATVPLAEGRSLAQLLADEQLDMATIRQAMAQIKISLAAADLAMANKPRSVASLAKDFGFPELSREKQDKAFNYATRSGMPGRNS